MAIDFDYAEQLIFWSDSGEENIRSIKLGPDGSPELGSKVQDVISNELGMPESLAVDWIGKKLYWTDTEKTRIEVANYDGSHRGLLFKENLEHPNSIALVPSQG